MTQNDSNRESTVLVIGDWVVDEYWFVVRHQSQISSHTGFAHFRIGSQEGEPIMDLCGAGEVAQALHQLGTEAGPYRLIGLGKWRDADTEYIGHLVHAKGQQGCPVAECTFGLSRQVCEEAPEVTLRSLDPSSPTIRVIRLYHQYGSEIKQLSRTDWEPQKGPTELDDFDSLGLPSSDEVSHVVVHDLAKGAVTDGLIGAINEKYPTAAWYVRSKVQNPGWLKSITRVELLVVGPEVAELLNPWQSWLAKGRATKKALDVIEGMPGRHVVMLSDQREVVARVNSENGDGGDCITARSHVAPTPITMLGWPSAVFAYFIHSLISSGSDISTEKLSEVLKWADENSGVPLPKMSPVSDAETREPYVQRSDWGSEVREWRQAVGDRGIVTDTVGVLRLDVWRGTTHLPGYVVHVSKKQEIIDRIGRHMIAFGRGPQPKRSLSILIQADPGAGKTHLAKTLAKEFGFRFLRYDLTQLIHRDELHDLFDAVANMQAEDGEPILVFVDEINAQLDGNHVYGAFLAPLEDGYYVRRGKNFSLRPCVWLFAGTKLDDSVGGQKLSDFKSRMTMIERIDYRSLRNEYDNKERLDREARLEQVYLGAILLQQAIPDVAAVEYAVLDQFYIMDPSDSPARAIRKRVALLSDVQYGTVTRKNCEDWGPVEWSGDERASSLVRLRY
jgi:hypothetical protein